MKLILSAFPGTGKSSIFKNASELGMKTAIAHEDFKEGVSYSVLAEPKDATVVFDSDSSLFDKSAFPENYISHIKTSYENHPDVLILVSSHDNVRKCLRENEIPYTLAYPKRELKAEYIERYKERGSNENFIKLMEESWNDFIDSCESDPTPNKIILGEGEYLIDGLKELGLLSKKETTSETFSRSDLAETSLQIKEDGGVLKSFLNKVKDDNGCTIEGTEDGGTILQETSDYIKKTYGVEVDPTISGMESFLEKLEGVQTKVGELIKEKPTKQTLISIGKGLDEIEKAFEIYTSEKWQSEQKFINIGKLKIQAPKIFNTINSPSDITSIFSLIDDRVDLAVNKYLKNSEARLKVALKIFNEWKGKDKETSIEDVTFDLPEPTDDLIDYSGVKSIDVSLAPLDLPVLTKENINNINDIVKGIKKHLESFSEKRNKLIEHTLVEDDFYNSDFWDAHLKSPKCEDIWKASEYVSVTGPLNELEKIYIDKIISIGKFLELWVLKSVKDD